MSPQQFKNRRNTVVSARPASMPKPVRVRSPLKPLVVIGAIVLFAFCVRSNESTTKAEVSLPVVQTPTVVTPVVKRTPFPVVATANLTSIQKRLLLVAKQEYTKNPTSYDANVMKYTEGFRESWCADFISWMRDEAGIPLTHPKTGYWRIPGVSTLRDYYQASNAYIAVGDYTPKLGDIAFYEGETPDGESSEHVAMVLSVDGDKVTTIGGNETNKGIVQIRTNKLATGERGLVGFGKTAVN